MPNKKSAKKLWTGLKSLLRKIPKVWRGALYIAGVLGAISGVLAYFPSMTIHLADPLEPNNPFSSPVLLTNDGLLCLNSITFITKLKMLSDPTGAAVVIEKEGVHNMPPFSIKRLCKGETSTFGLPDLMQYFELPSAPDYGDIELVFSFRPSFVIWRQTKSFRFAFTLKNNKYTWFPRAHTDKLR